MRETILVTPSDGVTKQLRTCRYGHGQLTHVESIAGNPLFLAIAYGFYTAPLDKARYVGPFQWHLCKVCGYMEMVDLTPEATLSMIGGEHG